MSLRFERWLYGLGAAAIGGGAAAITSGLTSMGFSPDKFNLSSLQGLGHLLGLMAANFVVSAFLSVAFYLRQSPLPPESTGDSNPRVFVKQPEQTTITKP